jgi:hypothetical protein
MKKQQLSAIITANQTLTMGIFLVFFLFFTCFLQDFLEQIFLAPLKRTL